MAEETVGSVRMDLVIEDTAGEQIENIAKKAVNPAQKSFNRVGKSIQATIDNSINKAFKEPAGFKVAENAFELMEQKLGNIGAQIGTVENKLKSAEAVYAKISSEKGFNSAEAKELETEITNLQSKLISLQSTAITTEDKLTKAMEAPKKAAEKAAAAVAKAEEKASKAAEKAQKKSADAAIKNTIRSTNRQGKLFEKLGRTTKRSFKAVFVTTALYQFFKAFKSLMSSAMSQNKEFTDSLNTIKGNLQVAFTPIIEAAMPMINKLMSGLATVTKYIATFVAAVFGKTYQQAVNTTKKVQALTKKAAKSTGRDFDELHNVEKEDSSSNSSTGGVNFDALNTDEIDSSAMEKLLSVAEKVRDVFSEISRWISEHIELIKIATIIVLAFATAWKVVKTVTAIVGGIGKAIGFLTNPIGLVVASIGLVIAIIALCIKYWDKIKAATEKFGAWMTEKSNAFGEKMESIVNEIVDWIVAQFVKLGEKCREVIDRIGNWFSDLGGKISDVFKRAFDFIKSMFKNYVNGWISIFEGFINLIISGVNLIVKGLNKINFKIPDWLPGVGGKSFGININEVSRVALPRLARGGIVDKPTLSLIGEAGKEAVVPLENNTEWIDKLTTAIVNAMITALGTGREKTAYSTGSKNGDLVLNINGKEFAKISLELISQYTGIKILETEVT